MLTNLKRERCTHRYFIVVLINTTEIRERKIVEIVQIGIFFAMSTKSENNTRGIFGTPMKLQVLRFFKTID